MSGLKTILDQYSRHARLYPALLTLFPIFLAAVVWTPVLYELAAGLLGLAVACGVVTALMHFARYRGRLIERELFRQWGGPPTTLWLQRSNSQLEAETKQRYCRFMESHVPDWHAPTLDDERADLEKAGQVYGSGIRWLREYTRDRDRFPLVFAENVSYGFRRNMLGLKPFGIIVALSVLVFSSVQLYATTPSWHPFPEDRLPQSAVMLLSLLCLLWWVLVVRQSWVRDAADGYAKALLAACDKI